MKNNLSAKHPGQGVIEYAGALGLAGLIVASVLSFSTLSLNDGFFAVLDSINQFMSNIHL